MPARISRVVLPPLIILVALIAYRMVAGGSHQTDLTFSRNEPLAIAPRYDDPRVVTDEQLAAVLDRVKPPAEPIVTNSMVHALRLWGDKADFGDAKIPSGRQLRDYFLDDAAFRRFAGEKAPPLFYQGMNGIEVRSFDDLLADRDTSSHHADDLLATLAESGVSLDATLKLRAGQAKVSDLLETSLRRFHLDQLEYEWTAIAYARYVFPQREWRNKYGQKIDVDLLVDEIVSHPLDLGPCNGLHRLEALAVLYRADEQVHALSSRTKAKILAYMKHVTTLLADSQHSQGYWTREWPRGAAAASTPLSPGGRGAGGEGAEVPKTAALAPTLHNQLLVTGHHLEWLALAPDEVQPPRETIVRAGQWLARTLIEMDQQELTATYGPYSHAARALCLWRSKEPFAAWKAGNPKSEIRSTKQIQSTNVR
jgi:hypothetical protein